MHGAASGCATDAAGAGDAIKIHWRIETTGGSCRNNNTRARRAHPHSVPPRAALYVFCSVAKLVSSLLASRLRAADRLSRSARCFSSWRWIVKILINTLVCARWKISHFLNRVPQLHFRASVNTDVDFLHRCTIALIFSEPANYQFAAVGKRVRHIASVLAKAIVICKTATIAHIGGNVFLRHSMSHFVYKVDICYTPFYILAESRFKLALRWYKIIQFD